MFLVIEGDNGTGKDTLATGLARESGFSVITDIAETLALKREAKTFAGEERIAKFAEYIKLCSSIASSHARDARVVIVRYWLSTVAAGFADGVLSYEKARDYERSFAGLEKPAVAIFLECDLAERTDRIARRAANDPEDLALKRSERYKWYLADFQRRLGIPFINIDTTGKTPAEVLSRAVKYIGKFKN